MDLSSLKTIIDFMALPVKKVEDLDPNKDYSVSDLRQVASRSGHKKVVLVIENEFRILLPLKVSNHFIENYKFFKRMVEKSSLLVEYHNIRGFSIMYEPVEGDFVIWSMKFE